MNCLKSYGVTIPENYAIIGGDFRNRYWIESLRDAGYDPTQKAFFMCEGVSMYLHQVEFDNILQFIKNQSEKGSLLVFDYFFTSVIHGLSKNYGAREQFKAVCKAGEMFRFGIDEGKIASFLSSRQFALVKHHDHKELEDLYLRNRDGNIVERVYQCGGIVQASN